MDVVPILLLANCFLALHIQISMWYKLADKTGAGAIIAGIGAIITVALNLLLIPIMGYMGAALTTLLVYMLLPLLSLIWSRKHYYIPYDLGKLAIFFSLAVGIVGLGYYLFPQMHFGLKALLIFLYIVVFCWVEKPLRKHAG
ncbi:MAG: polysaccharide biosynthesis C-terminal domain-containing protein [Luteibaculum sp.]